MAVQTYTPASGEVMRVCRVDFSSGEVPSPVILMQYDSDLIILAVQLYNNNVPFVLQAGDDANVKLIKPDGTVVYNPVLGCDENRTMVYVQVTYQMTIIAAELTPMIEIVRPNVGVVTSSYINMRVMRNPTPIGGLISENEIQILTNTLNDAVVAAEQAIGAATRVEAIYGRYQDVEAAGEYADEAEVSATNASASAKSARAYAELANAWEDVSDVVTDLVVDTTNRTINYNIDLSGMFHPEPKYLYHISIYFDGYYQSGEVKEMPVAETLCYIRECILTCDFSAASTISDLVHYNRLNVICGDQTFKSTHGQSGGEYDIYAASTYNIPLLWSFYTVEDRVYYPEFKVKVLRQRIGMTSVN